MLGRLGAAGITVNLGLSGAGGATATKMTPPSTAGFEIGDFESGLEGWQTNGGVTLARISATERPAVVENGDYALEVNAEGDAYPVIENRRKFDDQSLVDTPFLIGRISTTFRADYETLTVVLRYHHRATPPSNNGNGRGSSGNNGNGRGSSGNNGNGERGPLVEENTITVPLGARSGLWWDLSDLSTEKLETPERLEIGWYIGNSPPQTGPRGKQPQGPDPGPVYVDALRMTDSIDSVDRVALVNQIDSLRLQHGDYIYEAREFLEDGERGVFVFSDGTEIPVVWEDLGSDRERYTVDGETYQFGGGW